MKDMGIVHGSAAQALPVVINVDTVYVHTDIRRLPPDPEFPGAEMYEYHETQYGLGEYIAILQTGQPDKPEGNST